MKTCPQMQPEFCSKETLLHCFKRQQNEKPTSDYSRTTLEGSTATIQGLEKFKLRDCNYRNHRIYTLKCISNELVPVSLRLKTTLKTEKARKIIRKAERDLLQARVKSINSILGDNAKQIELSRSKLASIVSATSMDKCQQFIDKVSELRFLKIKERQVNKFNRLMLKKQGNITWSSTVPLVNPQAGSASPQVANASAPRQVLPGKTVLLRELLGHYLSCLPLASLGLARVLLPLCHFHQIVGWIQVLLGPMVALKF